MAFGEPTVEETTINMITFWQEWDSKLDIVWQWVVFLGNFGF